MDCKNAFDYSKNFEIQKLNEDKILIDIPLVAGNWRKEYDMNIPLSKLINDFKEENNLDISDLILNKFKIKNGTINLNYKLKDIIDNSLFSNYKNCILVGKPFNNPFEIFIFNRISKILTIQPTKKQLITFLGLNNYSSSSSYCNGNNHLYISGGETTDNQLIDKFFDIDLNNNNNNIEGPYTMSPKKNHSMIFIQPNKVFVIGGNDTKTFYFDTIKKEIINTADLNIIRTEPALQIIGNTLYCFDNVNKVNNDQLSFERINIDNPEAEWELVYPIIKDDKFPQKFFAVSKDINEENIIFLGGNMDDTNDSKNLNNFKYNIESNIIEETSIPFKEFNYKEKTFLPFNKNVDYLLPDFNRKHPEVTFFVKSKSRFEKVNYLPKPIESENIKYLNKRRYIDNKYNFNMPGMGMGISIGNNNINGIKEPSFNNNIDLENDEIHIKQEPPFKEPDIEPNKGDKQIDIAIPTNLNNMTKGLNRYNINMKMIHEEEKNSGDFQINDPKLKYGGKPISTSFNILNGDLNNNTQKIQSSINEPEKVLNYNFNLKESLGLNPEIKIKNQGNNINMESIEDPTFNIHLPKKGEINVDDIKLNAGFTQPKFDLNYEGIEANINNPKININGNIEDPTKNINTNLNTNIPGVNLDAKIPSIGIDVNKKDLNLKTNMESAYEGYIFGKDKNSQGYSLEGMIIGNKNNKSKISISTPDLNIKGGDININKGIDLKTNINGPNITGNLPNVELDLSKTNINPLDINIKGKMPEGNLNIPTNDINANLDIKEKDLNFKSPDVNFNLDGNIPNPELNLKGKIGGDIDGKLPDLKSKIEYNRPDIELKGSKNLGIKGKIPNVDLKNKLDTNLGLEGNINVPNVKLESNINKNINIKSPQIYEDITGIILGKKANLEGKDLNVNARIPETKITGEIPGKGSLDINKPNLNIKGPKIGAGLDANIPSAKMNLEGPKINGPNFELKGDIPGKNINAPKLNMKTGNVGLKGKVDLPNANSNINGPNINVDAKMPNIKTGDINIKGKDDTLIFSGIIPGKKALKIPKINGDLKIDGNLKKPELPSVNPDLNIGVDASMKNKEIDLNKKINDININAPGIGNNSPDINLKGKNINIPNASIEGKIPNIDINGNMPKVEGNIPGIDINPKIPNTDIDFNLRNNIPDMKLNAEMPNFDANIKKPELDFKGEFNPNIPNINIDKKDLPTGEINFDGKVKKPDLKGINFKANMPEIDIKKPEGNVDIDGKLEGKKINIDLPGIKIDKDGEFLLEGIIPGKDYKNLNIKGGKKIDLEVPNPKVDIKGGKGINAKINSPNVNLPSGNIDIKGPKLEKPDLNANIKGKDINIDGKMPNVKTDLNIDLPKGDLIFSGIIGGKKNIKTPKINGDLKLDGKIKGPKIEGTNIGLKKPEIDLNMKKDINLNKEININSPEIDITSPDFNLKGKNINIPNASIEGKMPSVDINGNIPKVEGKIPGIDIDAKIPNADVNGQIPKIDVDFPKTDMNIEGNIPNLNLEGKIPKANMNINAPKIDLEGNAPKINMNADIPNFDVDFKKPSMDINGEINPNLNLSPNIDLPQGGMNFKSGIPDLNLNGDINAPKIDASIEPPKIDDINLKAKIPKANIDIKKPDLGFNMDGEIKGKKLNVDLPNIKLNNEKEYYLSGVIPGKGNNDINIKGSRRMLYDYNINQPDVNIKTSKLKLNQPDMDMNIKGSRRLNIEAPNVNANLKGSRVLPNMDINSPNINKPSGNINIKGPNVEVPDVNIKGKNIKLDGKMPNVKADLNINEPKGDLIFSGIIGGKKNIKTPKINGDLKFDGKIKGPKIEGANIGLKKPEIDLNMKKDINLNKEININSPEIDITSPDFNLKGKKINIPNASLEGKFPNVDLKGNMPKIEGDIPGINIDSKIPNVDINGNMPKIEGNIPGINIDSKIPNLDINGNIPKIEGNIPGININGKMPNIDVKGNIPKIEGNIPGINIDSKIPNVNVDGQIPNVDVDIPNSNMNIKGNIPNLDFKGKIPNANMNINAPKFDLEGNLPNPNIKINKKNLNLPGLDVEGNVPNLGLKGEFDTNLPNLEINNDNKIDLPSGEINLKGKIPNMNLNGNIENKGFNIPKIDEKIEKPNVKDINLNANLPGIDINQKNINIEGDLGGIKKSDGSFNIIGEIEGKRLKIEKPNINLNKDKDYYIAGIIPGGNVNDINIKGSRRMLYDYNINQPDVNIKSSKIHINPPDMDMNIKGSRRLDFQAPNVNENIKGSRVLYNAQINNDYNISYNKPEIKLNSPRIDLNSGNKNIKLEKPEIKAKAEGELIFSGIIPGKKEYSKNIKLNTNIPKPEIKANMERQDIPNKVEIEAGINPPLINGINIDTKNINILSDQNLEIKTDNHDIKNSLKASNNNINIEMPKFDFEINKNENINEINPEINIEGKNTNIGIPQLEINLESHEKEQDNNLFNININNNLENQESKVYAKKGIKFLPKVGIKKEAFISSKVDVGGKLDVNNIDVSNMKPADAGANGTKIGNRIIE